VIVEVARTGAAFRLRLAILVKAAFSKTIVRRLVVMREVKVVFDKRGAGICVITDTITSDPWVQQWKSSQTDDEQDPFESAVLGLDLGIQVRFRSVPKKIA
jgi:hypothetical protein